MRQEQENFVRMAAYFMKIVKNKNKEIIKILERKRKDHTPDQLAALVAGSYDKHVYDTLMTCLYRACHANAFGRDKTGDELEKGMMSLIPVSKYGIAYEKDERGVNFVMRQTELILECLDSEVKANNGFAVVSGVLNIMVAFDATARDKAINIVKKTMAIR